MRTVVRRVAYAYGRRNRDQKAAFAIEFARTIGAERVLIVGASASSSGVNNLVERRLVDALPNVIVSGLAATGDWPNYQRADALALPFADKEFDLVYANAVIEHVGGEQRQRQMLAELDRVGRAWIATTPNRWFPIEAHRHTALTHWRRSWCPNGGITRLLGIREFEAMLPQGRVLGLPLVSPTLTAVSGKRN